MREWGFAEKSFKDGGISSYALFLMLVAFLQKKNVRDAGGSDEYANLGRQMLEFLDFYGHQNFSKYGIRCRPLSEKSSPEWSEVLFKREESETHELGFFL